MLVVFGVVAVLVFVIAILANKQQESRREALRLYAQQMGFQFVEGEIPVGGNNLLDLFSTPNLQGVEFVQFFDLFQRGSSRKIHPMMLGQDKAGTNWYLMDYQYTTSNGKSTTTHHFSVVLGHLALAFPAMTLSPEGLGTALGKLVGMNELQVESEEFNRRYYIQTSDQKLSLDLLHPLAIQVLLAQPILNWEFRGPYIMLHLDSRATVEQFDAMRTYIDQFVVQIPNYYRQDYGPHGMQ